MVMQSQLSTSTKMSHERAQQAIQDQALLEGRIMNAKSPCGPSRLVAAQCHLGRKRGIADKQEGYEEGQNLSVIVGNTPPALAAKAETALERGA
jgi:hypothetical protein